MKGQYAGFLGRVLAFVIDVVILSIFLVMMWWFLETTLTIFDTTNIFKVFGFSIQLTSKLLDLIKNPAFQSAVSFFVIILYYAFLWSFAGQTLGKAFLGIKVVPLRGGRMSFGRAIIRYFAYYVSAFAFGIGFLWILIDDRRQAWHDKLSGTCVIYAWNAKPDETFLASALEQLSSNHPPATEPMNKEDV